jgi:hypothetical protein
MKATQEAQWLNFCKSLHGSQKYSTDYWKKIKQISSQSSAPIKHKQIPNLFYKSSVISTDSMKAQIFGEVLGETFRDSNEPNFDQLHKFNVEHHLRANEDSLFCTSSDADSWDLDDEFNSFDLDSCLQTLSKSIPMDQHPKYLGVNLDRRIAFNYHTTIIRQKCLKLLNILKSLAYKSWSVSPTEQLTVYKLLIRSCMEYAAPLTILSNANIKLLQGVQHQALRIIFKAPLIASSAELHAKAKDHARKDPGS